MKRCKTCGRRKPLRAFYVNGRRGYRHPHCKACLSARSRATFEQSKAWIRDHCRSWYLANRELLASATAFIAEPPLLSRYHQLQHDAIMAYGGYRCACCGVDEPLFLTLDHQDGSGARHRERVGKGGKFYAWLRDNGYPPGFQVLCSNCNHGRFRNGGVCPHKYRQRAAG